MKKFRKAAFFTLLGLVFALSLMSVPALASTAIDGTRGCTLTIHYRHEGAPISGASFALYRTADVNAYGEFSLSGDFAGYPVLVNGLTADGWNALAETLAGYALHDGLTPLDSGVTDSSGQLTFPNQRQSLTPGLYLVLGQAVSGSGGIYTAEPFLISLPGRDQTSGGWRYDLTAVPKSAHSSVPTVPGGTVSLRVLKIWADQEDSTARPAALTVTLLKNGTAYSSISLTPQNNWRWSWSALPSFDETGLPIDWRIVEEHVPGYTVSVTRQGDTFFLTNTKIADAPVPTQSPAPTESTVPVPSGQPAQTDQELPKTGALWWPVPLLAAAGLVSLLSGAVLARRTKHD